MSNPVSCSWDRCRTALGVGLVFLGLGSFGVWADWFPAGAAFVRLLGLLSLTLSGTRAVWLGGSYLFRVYCSGGIR